MYRTFTRTQPVAFVGTTMGNHADDLQLPYGTVSSDPLLSWPSWKLSYTKSPCSDAYDRLVKTVNRIYQGWDEDL